MPLKVPLNQPRRGPPEVLGRFLQRLKKVKQEEELVEGDGEEESFLSGS